MIERTKRSTYLIVMLSIALLIVASITLANYLSFRNIEDNFLDEIVDKQLLKNEHSVREMQIYIKNLQDEITTLSKFPIINSNDLCTLNGKAAIKRIREKNNNDILVIDKNGDLISDCIENSEFEGFNFKNIDYYKIPKETKEIYTSNLITRGTNKEIIISAPIYSVTPLGTEVFEGVIITITKVDTLFNLFIHPYIEEGFYALYNLDSGNTIIISEKLEGSELTYDIAEKSHLLLLNEKDILVTHWDISVGNEKWRLLYITPLDTINQGLVSIQKRHIFSLLFVVIIFISIFVYVKSLYTRKEELVQKLDRANITLEKLGIRIETEDNFNKFSQADMEVSPGKIYLIKDENENTAQELFISNLNKGYAGLGIIREKPTSFKKKYNLQKTSFIWLSKEKSQNAETNLENIASLINEFILKSKKSIVLIDRLDYLILENEFESVIKLINKLKDKIQGKEIIILINTNPSLLEEKQLNQIASETYDLLGSELRNNIELSQLEIDLLRYVNENNIVNKLVSYKDISSKFAITKPTTRSKISNLQFKNLISVEQRGRFKSLKITSTGRRFI